MDCPAPILKLCQFRMALSLPWVTTMALALGVLMFAWPATRLAPSGKAVASVEKPASKAVSSWDKTRPLRRRYVAVSLRDRRTTTVRTAQGR